MPLESLYQELSSSPEGLTRQEAARRLEAEGPNVLPVQPPTPLWVLLGRQFLSPLIAVLIVAGLVSLATGDVKDAFFIGLVLIINAVIGGFQEWKAEKGTQALRKMLKVRATVVRDNHNTEIEASEIVRGDIVLLESGARVPADMRLVSAHGLEIDESLLTGESLAVFKDPGHVSEEDTATGDRLEMSYAGSVVIRGRGRGLVVATGASTVVGKLASDLTGVDKGKPPLVVRMEKFTRVIALVVVVAALAVSLLGVMLHGFTLKEMFFFSVALAVSAIPEGLPVSMTVALAVATHRMARRGVLVRQLSAVEGLGSCTMVASDKTGTLTQNQLTVQQLHRTGKTTLEVGPDLPRDADLVPLLEAAVLCNEGEVFQENGQWVHHGDPTDVALLLLGQKGGLERPALLQAHPLVEQVPFEPELKYAATYHQGSEGLWVAVKGAPETVAAFCKDAPDDLVEAEEMGRQGLRVLALARGSVSQPGRLEGLHFLGYVGMIDPLRPGVKESVARCQKAGMSVIMITGDHPVTALAIGRELGLAQEESEVATGPSLLDKSPQELSDLTRQIKVFARIDPGQKLQLVEAAQRAGHYVAVTGDGVNDAPALRTANIGVAMGKSGTDVAREAADLVITDDNFSTIVHGVEEGRIAYSNLRKVIFLLISTGAAEIVLVALAVFKGVPLPLSPAQLLWLNLVTNGVQDKALAFEPADGDPLEEAPRPSGESIFNRIMIERTLVAALTMGVTGFLAFTWMLENGWREHEARNYLLLLMVFFEIAHLGNCRSETRSALVTPPWRNPFLMVGSLLALLLQMMVMNVSWGQSVLSTQPVAFQHGLALLGISASIVVVMELHKFSWWLRFGRRS